MAAPLRIGRYEVLGELASGGMGEILLARLVGPSGFERPVVIKRILPQWSSDQGFVTMFLDEARIVSGIRHPNVVHVEELGHEGGELFLVMEYLEGESVSTLSKRLASRDRPLDAALAAHIIADACSGLHAAHEITDEQGEPRNLVHRDISPQNLLVTYQGQIKILDFGIAQTSDRKTSTDTGQVKGKSEYMSPEQCRALPLDRRSDVFALGIVLYEMLTGARLFKRFSNFDAMFAITNEPVVPPSRVKPGVPPELEKVCMKALARLPSDRYATAKEMRSDLVGALRTLPTADPESALAALMSEVFVDRIVEKRELLRRVRAGGAVGEVPPGEIDIEVELPTVSHTLARATTELQTPTPALRSRTFSWVAAGAVVVALPLAIWLGRGAWLSRSVAAEPPTLAASASAPPAIAETVAAPIVQASPSQSPPQGAAATSISSATPGASVAPPPPSVVRVGGRRPAASAKSADKPPAAEPAPPAAGTDDGFHRFK